MNVPERAFNEDELELLQEIDPGAYADYIDHVEANLPASHDSTAAINRLTPQRGPQTIAYFSDADVTLYGGAAGGGKTFLAIMLALKEHRRTLYIRREAAQLQAVKDELVDIMGHREGFNNQAGVWNIPADGDFPQRQVRFGGIATAGETPGAGDEGKYQGSPRDLLVVDEAANCMEGQVRFLMGWVRSTTPGQRQRTLLCSNPPTDAGGLWLISMFAPWLDPAHKNPAKPGELRWYATMDGVDVEVPDDSPLPDPTNPEEPIKPRSRTFIPAKVQDNAYLTGTGYVATLQALPEPLRSQMLLGDFAAGLDDDAYQVIPTDWIQRAQQRWRPPHPTPSQSHLNDGDLMTSLGVDPSRGGRDDTVLAPKWESLQGETIVDELVTFPGSAIPDGPTVGGHVLAVRRNMCPVLVDAIGVGTSVVDFLSSHGIQTEAITGSEGSTMRDRTGVFKMRNQRTELYWTLREALDPSHDPTLALPPDQELLEDLTAARYTILEGNILAVFPKEKIKKILGRSPGRGDAVLYATAQRAQRDGVERQLMQRGRRIRAGTVEHFEALQYARRPGQSNHRRAIRSRPRL